MVERVQELWSLVPSQFEGFWGSLLEFPLYGLDDVVKRLGAPFHPAPSESQSDPSFSSSSSLSPPPSSLPILLVWGDRDAAVPFDPCCERWQETLGAGYEAYKERLGVAVTVKTQKKEKEKGTKTDPSSSTDSSKYADAETALVVDTVIVPNSGHNPLVCDCPLLSKRIKHSLTFPLRLCFDLPYLVA